MRKLRWVGWRFLEWLTFQPVRQIDPNRPIWHRLVRPWAACRRRRQAAEYTLLKGPTYDH